MKAKYYADEGLSNVSFAVYKRPRGTAVCFCDTPTGAKSIAKALNRLDRIESGKDANALFAAFKKFHNEHYSVFPRGELTERLCHAFYDQFVGPPEAPCKEVEDWT